MVELLHPIVSFVTSISIRASLRVALFKFQVTLFTMTLTAHMWTHLRLVRSEGSSSVLVVIMVEGTPLQVVILWVLCTLFNLEVVKV